MKEAQLQAATLLAIEILQRTQPKGRLEVDVIASAFAEACQALQEGVRRALKEGSWAL
jgi:hypothetical protein